jgi:hypothetical protein
LQEYINKISNAEPISDAAIEPKHPSRFEKKTNMDMPPSATNRRKDYAEVGC